MVRAKVKSVTVGTLVYTNEGLTMFSFEMAPLIGKEFDFYLSENNTYRLAQTNWNYNKFDPGLIFVNWDKRWLEILKESRESYTDPIKTPEELNKEDPFEWIHKIISQGVL